MTASTRIADLTDPAYQAALRHLQKGEWAPGLATLKQLSERFPHDPTLQAMLEESEVRAHIDQDEREDRRRQLRRRVMVWVTRAAVIILLVLGLRWVVSAYSARIAQQMATASEALQAQTQAYELATKYANAQSYLRAGRLPEAQALLDEILAVDPAYPGVQMLLGQLEARTSLETNYTSAVAFVEQGDWNAALAILQSINQVQPGYKNVDELIALVERQMLLEDLWSKAETPYAVKSWGEAAAAYEGIRSIDPEYRRAEVEDRLYESYVHAGREALVGQEDSLEAMQIAEAYFRKALALRPQDREVKKERELARLYLLAQADFAEGRWTDVIIALEIVYAGDKEYANGAARQALYEAYVARGDGAMAGQQYETALSDYQVALALAQRDEDAVLRLYEAYLRAGDAYGAQEQFEPAVLMYRKAVAVGQLDDRALADTGLAEALRQAGEAVAGGNYSLAYEKYQVVFHGANTTQATITHVVQPGEYLIKIANTYHSTVKAIVEANNIQNRSLIYPGQELVIPVAP